MRRRGLGLILAAGLGALPSAATAPADLLARLPIGFEPNVGQMGPAHPEVLYAARGDRFHAFLSADGALLAVPGDGTAVRMTFLGTRSGAVLRGEEPLPGVSHYLRGTDRAAWRSAVPRFGGVRVAQLYDGIDILYHSRQGAFELDVVVAPGAATPIEDVELLLAGADELCVDASGDLVIRSGSTLLVNRRPIVHQIAGGRKEELAAAFELRGGNRVGFHVEGRAAGAPLVVDPVLEYSTYLGGGRNDAAYAIAVDNLGYAYVTGFTSSLSFPLKDPLQGTCGSCGPSSSDAFVAKITPDGAALVYSTYLGGSGRDTGAGIAVDRDDKPVVAGTTDSPDFPLAQPIQPQHGGGLDGFVARLTAAGDALEYATYLGGSGDDRAASVAVSYPRSAHVVGSTSSADFPVASALQATPGGGSDGFLVKVDENGYLAFATYLGDGSFDEARDVAVDGTRSIYVAGDLFADDLVRLDSRGTIVVYRASIPGSGTGRAVAVDAWSYAMLAGERGTCRYDGQDPVVLRVDPYGNTVAITDVAPCGDGPTEVRDVAVDVYGNAYVSGATQAGTLMSCPSETYFDGTWWDGFVASLDTTGKALPLRTTIGGADYDSANGIAVDTWGTVWIAGETRSADFPTYLPMQAGLANDEGVRDAFVTRLVAAPPGAPPGPDFTAVPRSGAPALTVWFTDASSCAVDQFRWDFGDGATSNARNPVHTYGSEGVFTVSLSVTNGAGTATLARPAFVTVGLPIFADFAATPTDGVLPLQVAFHNLTQGNVTAYIWEFGDGATSSEVNPQHTYTSLGTFTVALTAIGPFARNTDYATDFVRTREVLPALDAIPRIVRPGQNVQFVNGTRGAATGFLWGFGDGTTSAAVDPGHVFTNPGYYPITLQASGATTTETVTMPDYVLVSGADAVQMATGPGPDPAAPPRVDFLDVFGSPHGAAAVIPYAAPGYGAHVGTGALEAAARDAVLTGPGTGPSLGPQVRAFRPDGTVIGKVNFYAYGTLRYGVRAVGIEVDGDATDEILTGASPVPVFGPHVRGFNFDGGTLTALSRVSFFAYGSLRYGVHTGPGDVASDLRQEILTAPGPGATFGSQVRGFRLGGTGIETVSSVNFFAFAGSWYGAHVGSSDLEGLPREQMLAGLGAAPTLVSSIRGFHHDGSSTAPIPEVDVEAFPGGFYGATAGGGDLDGDGAGEILATRGPDPAGPADLRGFDFTSSGTPIPSTMVTAIPSLAFAPYPSTYGVHAATGKLDL